MVVKIERLKIQLMSKIDPTDLMQVEKVERYIDLVKAFRTINAKIDKEGETLETKNGMQSFTKAHPLITERNKINASLLSIEKSFGFHKQKAARNSLSELI